MSRYKSTLFIFLLLVAAGVCIFAVIDKKELEKNYRGLQSRHYFILNPEVPAKAIFAGENVPLDLYFVRESLEREIIANTYMHSSTILMLKRAYRWFPVIEPILKKNGIPDDFKFLALAESNFANVTSPAGAEGFWQFLKATGKKYGLEVTEEVDERYNLEKATEAACRYFREAHDLYGSWTLAAAAFNRGIDGLTRALENQKVSDYYDLYLNDETARYLFRILAIKQIYHHPVSYGFYLRYGDLYPPVPVYRINVDTTITDLPAFARSLKVNYRILREFNPWLQRYNLPNPSGKTYTFALPKEGMLSWEVLYKSLPRGETFFNDTVRIDELH